MCKKKCFSNFLQVLRDYFKSWVSNFFGEGFLRKSNLKIFTIELKVEIWAKNVTLFAFPWVPNGFCWKKIFAQGVLGWAWLNKSAGETTSLVI